MTAMASMKDNEFELAIVDPPYGIGAGKGTEIYLSNNGKQDWKGKNKNDFTIYGDWDDSIPDEKYFTELFRVSINQIIWGGNYFPLPPSQWIVWDKLNGNSFFADGEMAWKSDKGKLRIFKYLSCGFMGSHKNREHRIHPTQKPVALYRWLLQNYAKPGDKIIDTHSGSGSLACACHLEKFDFLAIEKDEDYYKSSIERLETLRSQGTLF
jgi:site-specific DNA-methyltransferase (adenine-specific)